MWGGSLSYRRCHKTLQPLPNAVSSQGLHTDQQQTMCTGIWKTLLWRVLHKPPCAYLPIYCEPISGFCKTCIWLRNTAFRFFQLQCCPVWRCSLPGLHFYETHQESVVRHTSTHDLLSGTKHLPFTSCTTRLTTQAQSPDLRWTCADLQQWTRPLKKLTNLRDVKRHLNVASWRMACLLLSTSLFHQPMNALSSPDKYWSDS